MSEQCSLYINIQIKEEKLQQFFQKKPLPQSIDENWLQWWESREMSGNLAGCSKYGCCLYLRLLLGTA